MVPGPDRSEDTMFTGLLPAMVTPFDERGEVDLGVTEVVVERFIEAGVDSISPFGSTGEASHLASKERKRFIEEVPSTSFWCEIGRSCRISMPKKPTGAEPTTMIVNRYDPVNLFELVPKLKLQFEPE